MKRNYKQKILTLIILSILAVQIISFLQIPLVFASLPQVTLNARDGTWGSTWDFQVSSGVQNYVLYNATDETYGDFYGLANSSSMIYAVTGTGAVLNTTDWQNWTVLISNSMPSQVNVSQIGFWDIYATMNGTLFVSAANHTESPASGYGILRRSGDEGQNWGTIFEVDRPLHTGRGLGEFLETANHTLFWCPYGEASDQYETDGCVYKSADNGQNWELIFNATDYWGATQPTSHVHGAYWDRQLERLIVGEGEANAYKTGSGNPGQHYVYSDDYGSTFLKGIPDGVGVGKFMKNSHTIGFEKLDDVFYLPNYAGNSYWLGSSLYGNSSMSMSNGWIPYLNTTIMHGYSWCTVADYGRGIMYMTKAKRPQGVVVLVSGSRIAYPILYYDTGSDNYCLDAILTNTKFGMVCEEESGSEDYHVLITFDRLTRENAMYPLYNWTEITYDQKYLMPIFQNTYQLNLTLYEYQIPGANLVFQDDFEDGDISDWTVPDNVTVSSSESYNGTYSALYNRTATGAFIDFISPSIDLSSYDGISTTIQASAMFYIVDTTNGTNAGSFSFSMRIGLSTGSEQGSTDQNIRGMTTSGWIRATTTYTTSQLNNATIRFRMRHAEALYMDSCFIAVIPSDAPSEYYPQFTAGYLNLSKVIVNGTEYDVNSTQTFNEYITCLEIQIPLGTQAKIPIWTPFGEAGGDSEKPTYSTANYNTTLAGKACKFSCYWQDNVNISHIIFSTNNSGTWVNYTYDQNQLTFYSTTSDGWIVKAQQVNYVDAWNASSGSAYPDHTTDVDLGQQWLYGYGYSVMRSFIYFDTSTLGNIEIVSARICLWGKLDHSIIDFNITIQNGQTTYPHDPMVGTDFNRTYYSGDGGSYNTSSGWSISSYNNITLNSDGIDWINTIGTTKLCLRSNKDISGTAPSDDEWVVFRPRESGLSYAPLLVVTTEGFGTQAWLNKTLTLNSTVGQVVGYRWYCNDTSNNWNDTGILALTTTEFISNTVTLNSPSDGASSANLEQTFNYTPQFSQTIQNASLWINISGVWQNVQWNTTIVTNDTQNSISYTFTQVGTYIWNVKVFNSTHGIFAVANRTITITGSGTVTLNSPSDGASSKNMDVDFKYSPVFSQSIENASLWINITGVWQRISWNATTVLNNTQNTISYTFTEFGVYIWNIQVFNSTHGIFASSNRTIRIYATGSVSLNTPSDGYSTSQTNINFTFTAIFSQTIHNASLWINITGIWQNVGWNITIVLNNTVNGINYTFGSLGTYIWNIQVFNGTHGIFASANRTITITTVTNRYYFNFAHRDIDSNNIDARITWKLYNSSQLLTYTEGQASLLSGTYTLKTSYLGKLINSTSLATSIYGNTTVTINLYMKVHSALSNGYISFNATISGITINKQTSTNLTFTVSGTGGPWMMVIGVPKNASYMQKNGVNQTGWLYNSGNNRIMINITSLSTWMLIFPTSSGNQQGGTSSFTITFYVTVAGDPAYRCEIMIYELPYDDYKGVLFTNEDGYAEREFSAGEYRYVADFEGMVKNNTFSVDQDAQIKIEFEKARFKLSPAILRLLIIFVLVIIIIVAISKAKISRR